VSYDLSDYVDVAARLKQFFDKWPNGTMQGHGEFVYEDGKIVGYHYRAEAYRTNDDPRPGVGTAFEPIPGKTPYTKDSEVMNAETSAWGRAIVACGFETKKIASADEVRARENGENPAEVAQRAYEEAALRASRPSDVPVHFGKNKGTPLGALTPAQLKWYAETWPVQENASAYDEKLKVAARALLRGDDTTEVLEALDAPF
jgi:hypothetical protein